MWGCSSRDPSPPPPFEPLLEDITRLHHANMLLRIGNASLLRRPAAVGVDSGSVWLECLSSNPPRSRNR
uniref:Uncharacterized protein n=1 Tax=Mycena chlorophos TaxID=658473 RepID=A0ABQ0LSJ2_MYCCL|nr:predicted protein [Mycena chlorophos]